MSRNTLKKFFGKQYVCFPSKQGKARALKKLQNTIHSEWTLFPMKQGIHGSADEKRVTVHRVIPFFRNSFIPVFIGEIQAHENGCELKGYFSGHFFSRVFMVIWFSAVSVLGIPFIAMEINAIFNGGDLESIKLWGFSVLALWGFGYLLIKLGMWFARNDIDYISSHLRENLK